MLDAELVILVRDETNCFAVRFVFSCQANIRGFSARHANLLLRSPRLSGNKWIRLLRQLKSH